LRIIKAAEERGFDVTAHEMAEIAANSNEDAQ
jgi:acetolactate synthase regulatory subunit